MNSMPSLTTSPHTTVRKIVSAIERQDTDSFIEREWLVTNGLGGYASSTLAGVNTRKYHGVLVAAHAAPIGRLVMLSGLTEALRLSDGKTAELGGEERSAGDLHLPGAEFLKEFRLENGLPVWRYQVYDCTIEKKIFMPYMQNTVYINYRLVAGTFPVRLRLRPTMHFRSQECGVGETPHNGYAVSAVGRRYSVTANGHFPELHLYLYGKDSSLNLSDPQCRHVFYRVEQIRCSEDQNDTVWTPGFFRVILTETQEATLVASTEPWDIILSMKPAEAFRSEQERRQRLIAQAHPVARKDEAAELVLAADQFIVAPATRLADAGRAHASGEEFRSIMAGYHWFTDWGRDTMISLEGLTLATGRIAEAAYILRTFARYVRDGLIPNMFPEGKSEGLYHTADATLWFFHAMDRYVEVTGDRTILRQLLPKFVQIIHCHLNGTRFGIGVDPKDSLLKQGAEGYQLTWMDAKVGEWVVTPRRGKAVEINALWYNALRLLEKWLRNEGDETQADSIAKQADRVFEAFNDRFWYDVGEYLYDLLDGEQGNDPSFRPNQIFAVSLQYPVLDPSRWESVVHRVQERLLTPFGLRSLAADHPNYKARYHGDVCERDAAYHQGTVWAWLIGPFIDAWLKTHTATDDADNRSFLEGLFSTLDKACIGSISEVFDADPPFRPEGCVAQAWSVAELLRSWIKISEKSGSRDRS